MVRSVWFTYCAHRDCKASIKAHLWGSIKNSGWFHKKDGTSWCPEHIPDWVNAWRSKKR